MQILAFIVALFPFMAAQAQIAAPSTALEAQAQEFVTWMAGGEHNRCFTAMDTTMRAAMPESKIKQVWDSLQKQAGQFQSVGKISRADAGTYKIVLVTCQFARTRLDAKIVYDPSGKVAGLFFVPSGPPPKPIIPAYAKRDKFKEFETYVVTGKFRLPATLTLPIGETTPPVVIMVHGSGPNDRDETIGPNKIFRDLAWGLGTLGIASLRYDKRTQVYRTELDLTTLTHREEVVEDALSAVQLASDDPRLGPVILLGHSLGGTIAPLIASESKNLEGIVIMAGSNRPLLEMMREQFDHIFGEDGQINAEEKKYLQDYEQAKLDLLNGKNANRLLGGMTKHYIEAFNAYDPVDTARQLTLPILLVQGKRDYQVLATKDFLTWKKALSDRKNVELKLYDDLDHLFISGEGPSYPSDYAKAGNVSEVLLRDLANWIYKVKP